MPWTLLRGGVTWMWSNGSTQTHPAFWLHTHFPELAPVDVQGVLDMDRAERFDLLLFLDAH
jgi:hypothetical protein